jgi:hypothetical protein
VVKKRMKKAAVRYRGGSVKDWRWWPHHGLVRVRLSLKLLGGGHVSTYERVRGFNALGRRW